MPSIRLHPRSIEPIAPSSPSSSTVPNPLPPLLQTPSGLALLELQGTINVPSSLASTDEAEHKDNTQPTASDDAGPAFETPIGKLIFPDYSAQNPDDTNWMKRAYLYVGRYQRMTGEVKKLPRPIAVLQKRRSSEKEELEEELEVVEIVRYKIFFKNRPEPVNDV